MNHRHDPVIERFEQRLAAIEAEVPPPPPWRPDDGARATASTRSSGHLARSPLLAMGVVLLLAATTVVWQLATRPADDETRPSTGGMPPGLITEPVEPGVARVLADGHRAISSVELGDAMGRETTDGGFPGDESQVHVLGDGSVWLFLVDTFFELGEAGAHALPGTDFMTYDDHIAFGPDGTIYKLYGWRPADWEPAKRNELWAYDGTTWSPVVLGSDAARDATRGNGLATDVDGAVWFFAEHGLYRLDGDDWVRVHDRAPGDAWSSYAVDATGRPWVLGGSVPGASRYLEPQGVWRELDPSAAGGSWPTRLPEGITIADVNEAGTVWVHAGEIDVDAGPYFGRYADGEWTTFDDDEVPREIGRGTGLRHLHVTPDGSVWLDRGTGNDADCAGLSHFDGSTWSHFLDDHCIFHIDSGPGGRVWVAAGLPDGDGRWVSSGLYIVDRPNPNTNTTEDDMDLKKPLATAVAVAALASPVATAQADISMAPALVTGHFAEVEGGELVPTIEFVAAAEDAGYYGQNEESQGWVREIVMDDPRLSGRYTSEGGAIRFFGESRADEVADVNWGTVEIVNDDGAWYGRSVGTTDILGAAPGTLPGVTYYELTGSGAYEGLSAVIFEKEDYEGPQQNPLAGIIYPGELPPE